MNNKPEKFIGFPNNPQKGDFWMYPTVMDNYWKYLNGSEQKFWISYFVILGALENQMIK